MAQYFYVVGRVFNDTGPEAGYGPDVPIGTQMSGSWHPPSNTYLISAPEEIAGLTPLTDAELTAECESRGISEAAIRTWEIHLPPELDPDPE